MWFSVVCTLIDNDVRHHSGQKILTTVMTRIVVDKSTDHAKPHFDLFFYHNTNVKECFFRLRVEKSIAWHIDSSSVVLTLIDNGKLANQIARLVAIVGEKIILQM